MLFSHFDFLLGLSRCATVFPLFFSYSFVCFVCSFACFVFPFLFSSGVFLVSRCSRYGALSHFSLCPAYVLLDLTSHGTDFLFPLFCSVLLSSSSLPFFFFAAAVLQWRRFFVSLCLCTYRFLSLRLSLHGTSLDFSFFFYPSFSSNLTWRDENVTAVF